MKRIFKDLEKMSEVAAAKFISIGNQAIKKTDRFSVALAGGSTPSLLYKLLASNEYKSKIDWERVFFFFGDERDVSPMSERSNYKMVKENMLDHLPVPKTNIFRWHTEIINAPEVAESFQKTIARFFKLSNGEFPDFDLILLGMGDDGHTASLFPFTDALHEDERIAVANYVEKFDEKRLTLTFPVLNAAKNIVFLVTGENKAIALQEVLEGEPNFEKFPAQNVTPSKGKLYWFADKSAASLLSK